MDEAKKTIEELEKRLSPKQRKFIHEYILAPNGTQAYKNAGYKYSSDNMAAVCASNLLRKPNVKAYLDARMGLHSSSEIADEDEILRYFTLIMRGKITEQIPILVGDGTQSLEDKGVNIKDRLKAAELLGKRYGTFTENVNINGGVIIVDGETDLE